MCWDTKRKCLQLSVDCRRRSRVWRCRIKKDERIWQHELSFCFDKYLLTTERKVRRVPVHYELLIAPDDSLHKPSFLFGLSVCLTLLRWSSQKLKTKFMSDLVYDKAREGSSGRKYELPNFSSFLCFRF